MRLKSRSYYKFRVNFMKLRDVWGCLGVGELIKLV